MQGWKVGAEGLAWILQLEGQQAWEGAWFLAAVGGIECHAQWEPCFLYCRWKELGSGVLGDHLEDSGGTSGGRNPG